MLGGISNVTSGSIHGVVDQTSPVTASNSSDYVGSANTTQMRDRVVKLYNGTALGVLYLDSCMLLLKQVLLLV